ncbi:tonB-system energizer ExbB [Glycocaulis profundi]|nr:tonB-system energizer ExbB [Glycocaulis profundi]
MTHPRSRPFRHLLLLFAVAAALFAAGAAPAPVPPPSGAEPADGPTEPIEAPDLTLPSDPRPGADDPSVASPAPPALPHDLSPWGMFVAADWVVKAVMIGLALASVLTWTVFLAKSVEIAVLKRRLRQDLEAVRRAPTLDAAEPDHALGAALAEEARAELALSGRSLEKEGVKERMTAGLSRLEAGFARRLTLGMGMLASVGATAPFVGLFGTVWGIMNSFIGISRANTTNLAVVAPGIAEALLATALGLAAAIPAVLMYNHFTRQVAGVRALAADLSSATLRLVSRDLDRGASALARPQAAE